MYQKGHLTMPFFAARETIIYLQEDNVFELIKEANNMEEKEPGFPANWDEICYEIMKNILIAKFSVPELKDKLKATGDAVLIEGNNHHDNRWGNCICDRSKNKEGQNWLGKILMEVRDTL
ncbi:MAG: NADAR family protein [Clostridiales bacterium]|nr:NADAR family protein [Clostridiales bacterium]